MEDFSNLFYPQNQCAPITLKLLRYFTRPLKERRRKRKFDIGILLLPVFTSPVIFIPLLAALQNVDMDLMDMTAPRLMVFFVAFENGFFWKGYLAKRQEEIKQGKTGEKAEESRDE